MLQCKWFGLGVAVLFCIAGSAQAGLIPYSSVVLADNPTVYYQFEELAGTAATNSGTAGAGGNGTYKNVTLGYAAPIAFPQLGVCGLYNGLADTPPSHTAGPSTSVGSSTTIPAIAAMYVGLNNYSIEFWFQAQKAGVRGDPFYWAVASGTSNILDLYNSTDYARFYEKGSSTTLMKDLAAPDATWHHYVVTRTSKIYDLYLDGVKTNVSATVSNMNVTSSWVCRWIGWQTNTSYTFKGPIDEFAFYTTSLSQAKVTAHYNAAQIPIPEPGTLALLAAGLAGLLCYAWRKRK